MNNIEKYHGKLISAISLEAKMKTEHCRKCMFNDVGRCTVPSRVFAEFKLKCGIDNVIYKPYNVSKILKQL